MSACRSCGAPIEWAISEPKGRRMPLDPLPPEDDIEARQAVLERANIVVHEIRGLELRARVYPTAEVAAAHRVDRKLPPSAQRISHFVTCPNAKRHRRRP